MMLVFSSREKTQRSVKFENITIVEMILLYVKNRIKFITDTIYCGVAYPSPPTHTKRTLSTCRVPANA